MESSAQLLKEPLAMIAVFHSGHRGSLLQRSSASAAFRDGNPSSQLTTWGCSSENPFRLEVDDSHGSSIHGMGAIFYNNLPCFLPYYCLTAAGVFFYSSACAVPRTW